MTTTISVGKEGGAPGASPSPPVLHLVRLPGEFGPILRCQGSLTVATTEALRRELALLDSLNHPVIILNLNGCRRLDVEGVLAVLEYSRQRRAKGRRLIVVTGRGAVARLLRVVGMDQVLPVYSSEEAATFALRDGWPRLPGPETWSQARAETVVRWQVIQEALDEEQHVEVLRLLTSMTALCERSEEILQECQAAAVTDPDTPRCQFCPLFEALGGQADDIGCRSLLDPIIAAVEAGDVAAAGTQVLGVIDTLRRIPLPVEDTESGTTAAGRSWTS